MRVSSSVTIGNRTYKKGSWISWRKVYPGFLLHVGGIGTLCFAFSYLPRGLSAADHGVTVAFGLFASAFYIFFYLRIFGVDEIKWLFINSGLGLYGIYSEIELLLSLIGRDIHEYSYMAHVAPFTLYMLYTFLLRQMILDITRSRENKKRQQIVNLLYVVISILVYTFIIYKKA